MKALGEVLLEVAGILERGPVRWPVVRLGEREPIPWLLRLSVLRRDDYRCKICGTYDPTGAFLELDHCLPWSAGGPDDSDNLRTLCRPCNQRRSNFDDGADRTRRLPTTWWCAECWAEPAARNAWADGTDLNRAPFVADSTVLAYCAWCMTEGYTDQPLTGAYARLIAGISDASRSAG